MYIIDRRENPKGKSLSNRQRFMERARKQIKEAVREASAGRRIADIEGSEQITIPADGLREPSFRARESGGIRDHVLPGNKEFVSGDRLRRPPPGQSGGRGREASADGDGEDSFRFVLSKEEFLDLFLEDLELPDLMKKSVAVAKATTLKRAGYSSTGAPSNLNLVRTMRNSLSRRIALKRPKGEEITALEAEIFELEASGADPGRLARLVAELETLTRRSMSVPFIDPIDVRYNRFTPVPRPITQAVMFCLMDVSGSMTEYMKDLAKRFFMLLYLFIERRYENVEIVFVRHTHHAEEVDEQTFFYSRETGGTLVSSALEEMRRIVADRYPLDDWNIYAAQASDGDNMSSDGGRLVDLLENHILPISQYFAYIEVSEGDRETLYGRETNLWTAYRAVAARVDNFAMRKVGDRGDIFPVFQDLFSKDHVEG
ncbi:YeaH/YhbH family protein [Fodinicurvata sp. EGI_FJ10296]|uniref:YeaH/YhbH family protein n=1 Tax=Fodinicurvata sp. EGI_FJ10296 TaxID=3231908 RepID=UPI0034540062